MVEKRVFRVEGWRHLKNLEGRELAGFGQRARAFLIDIICCGVLLMLTFLLVGGVIWLIKTGGRSGYVVHVDIEAWYGKLIIDILVPILYFGLQTYFGNGQTIGKRKMGIRVVALFHPRLSFWQCVERALGYVAASLEFGFGFFQFFIHPNRQTVQDRLAETIVVKDPPAPRHRPVKKAL